MIHAYTQEWDIQIKQTKIILCNSHPLKFTEQNALFTQFQNIE